MAAPSWYTQNANRAYPFLKGTVHMPDNGPLTLLNVSNELVVDAGFVVGPKSGFETGTHSVYLARIRRSGSYFYFDFESDAPALYGIPLTFSRHVDGPDYALEYVDSGELGLSATSLSGSGSFIREMCDEPLWSGFLVSGKMEALKLLLPGNGVVYRANGACTLEPALVQNLARSFVTQLALANDDRTRVAASDDCPEVVFPYPTDVVHTNDLCLVGDLVFKPGFNAYIRQGRNMITLGAGVGMGEGEPCEEVKLFPTERPPEGSDLLEGGPRCNETVRSINGVGGRLFNLIAGTGVVITSVPEEHKVIIDVNLSGLAIQFNVSAVSESC